MPLRIGETAFKAFHHGPVALTAIYLGDEKIWPEGVRLTYAYTLTASPTTTHRVSAALTYAYALEAAARTVHRPRALFSYAYDLEATARTISRASAAFTYQYKLDVSIGVLGDWNDDWSNDFGGNLTVPGDWNDDWNEDF